VVPLSAEHDMPSYWLPYATVADVDAALRRATAAGARIGQPATDLPQLGRYAVVLDDEGAGIALWKGITDDVANEGEQPEYTICWSELLSKDVQSAVRFYSEVIGWFSHIQDMGELGDYYVFRTDDDGEVAGMKEMPFDSTSLPHWLSYVLVPDLDETAAKVEPAGGKLLVPPADIPGLGRFFVASDPSGAEIGAVRFAG
jgi:predicted enzyme related to lactoylglutathione lyase